MIRIRARVVKITGACRHYQGQLGPEGPIRGQEFPETHFVEIEQGNEGFYMFYFDKEGECFTDGWYPSLEEAKAQANFEFAISDEDWVTV